MKRNNKEDSSGYRHSVKVRLTLIQGEHVHEVDNLTILAYSDPCSVRDIITCLVKAKTSSADISINIIEISCCLNNEMATASDLLELTKNDVLAMDTSIVSVEQGYVWIVTASTTTPSSPKTISNNISSSSNTLFSSPIKDQMLAFNALKQFEKVVIDKNSSIVDDILPRWNEIINLKYGLQYESQDSSALFDKVVTLIKEKLEKERGSGNLLVEEKMLNDFQHYDNKKSSMTSFVGTFFEAAQNAVQNVFPGIFGRRPVVKQLPNTITTLWNPYGIGFYRNQDQKPCCLGPLMSMFCNIPQLINASLEVFSIDEASNIYKTQSQRASGAERWIKSFKKVGDIAKDGVILDDLLKAMIYHAHYTKRGEQECDVFNTVTHLHTAMSVGFKDSKHWKSFELLDKTFSRMLNNSFLLEGLFRFQCERSITCCFCSSVKELPVESYDYIDLRQCITEHQGMKSLDDR